MKHLKSFENKTKKLKYKVGDYVLLDMLDAFDFDDCAGVISEIESVIDMCMENYNTYIVHTL